MSFKIDNHALWRQADAAMTSSACGETPSQVSTRKGNTDAPALTKMAPCMRSRKINSPKSDALMSQVQKTRLERSTSRTSPRDLIVSLGLTCRRSSTAAVRVPRPPVDRRSSPDLSRPLISGAFSLFSTSRRLCSSRRPSRLQDDYVLTVERMTPSFCARPLTSSTLNFYCRVARDDHR
jgi:hypothetical protein